MSDRSKLIGQLVLYSVLLLFGLVIITILFVRWILDPGTFSGPQEVVAFLFLIVGAVFCATGAAAFSETLSTGEEAEEEEENEE